MTAALPATPAPADRRDKAQRVLEAAFDVFARYGYARTTMGDLAAAAGISRPALYLLYCGKAEVFQAVVGWSVGRTLQDIEATLDPAWPLQRQLLHVAELAVGRSYDMLKANPDAADLMAPEHHGPALEAHLDRLRQLIAGLLRPAVTRAGLGIPADELAAMLMAAMKGFKLVARDGVQLRQMIAAQVLLTVLALGEPMAA